MTDDEREALCDCDDHAAPWDHCRLLMLERGWDAAADHLARTGLASRASDLRLDNPYRMWL